MGRWFETDSTWYENDGLVNTISMSAQKTGEKGSDQIIRFNKDISQFLQAMVFHWTIENGSLEYPWP